MGECRSRFIHARSIDFCQRNQDYSIDKGKSIRKVVLKCLVEYIENIHIKPVVYGSTHLSHTWESEAGGLLEI